MSSELEMIRTPETPNFAPRLYGIAALVLTIVVSGLWLVMQFTANDLARDVQGWQEKLSLIAESRTADVNHWVADNFKGLRTLADNPSLQLYMTELQSPPADGNKGKYNAEPAQKTYLRNLLLFTAERAGFSVPKSMGGIPANVQPESKSGLAIIGANDEILVSTLMQASTREMMLENVKQSAAGQEGLVDIRRDDEGTAYIGFIVPIFSIQGDRNAASQIGRVVGIKTIDSNLFGLLKHPGTTEKTLESILVRPNGETLEYLSPLQDGTTALSKQVVFDPLTSVEARLVKWPGDFFISQPDYRDKVVLATSRAIAGTPWTLIVKIDRHEALSQSEQRRAGMVTLFFMIIAIIVLIIVANWWHAHSKRSMLMSAYFRDLASHAMAQEMLLRLVADNQPEPIYIVDAQHNYHFANRKTAEEAGMTADSILGKALVDVRGAARAQMIEERCQHVIGQNEIMYDTQRIPDGENDRVIRSAYVPLEHIPVVTLPKNTPGVLIVEQDISEVIHERERRLGIQRQLTDTLVKLVDQRDPFAANHSQLVSQVAYQVAVDMELDDTTVETTGIAGSLMNIGKIVVPPELLTKTESLTAEERRIIRDSMNAAADVLAGISFDGPVAETLRQWQEKWDGTGPLGLSGESILVSARIIAVANAFIGMISPRSWRTAMPIDAAAKVLLDNADTWFDRRVVIALIHYVENHSGRAWLRKILGGQAPA